MSRRTLLAVLLLSAWAAAARAEAEREVPQQMVPALPDGAWRVSWDRHDVPSTWPVGEVRTVSVVSRNLGDVSWPDRRIAGPAADGNHAVRLSYCWRRARGETQAPAASAPLECLVARADLGAPVTPGLAATLSIAVRPPAEPGSYEPWFDPSRRDVLWSNQRHALMRVSLRQALEISLERRMLTLRGPGLPGGALSQAMEWPPDTLALAIETPAPLRVLVRTPGTVEARALPAGAQTLSLPAVPMLEIQGEPADVDARLLGVKAVAARP